MKRRMRYARALCLAGLLTAALLPVMPVQAAGHHSHHTAATTCYKRNGMVCTKKNHQTCTNSSVYKCRKKHTHTSSCAGYTASRENASGRHGHHGRK